MKAALLRYGITVAIILATVLLSVFYYSSELYTGPRNARLPELPRGDEIFSLLWMAFLIVGLKYLIYDGTTLKFRRKLSSRAADVVFYAGYGLALAIDVYAVFISSAPLADAGFAVLATIMYSPVVMIAALIALSVMSARHSSARQ